MSATRKFTNSSSDIKNPIYITYIPFCWFVLHLLSLVQNQKPASQELCSGGVLACCHLILS